MKRVEEEPALLLSKRAVGESDLVVCFYCKTLGKITAIARGARRSKKRFGAALGIFTKVELTISMKLNARMWTLESAIPVHLYEALPLDIACLAHGSYGTELVRELSADEFPDPELYELLLVLYESLQADGAKAGRLRVFELRLLDIVGLTPVFRNCACCHSQETEESWFFDASKGGVVCLPCSQTSDNKWMYPISMAGIAFLEQAQSIAQSLQPISAGDALDESASAVLGRKAMLSLLYWHVGKPLKSVQFIAKLSKRS